MKFKACDITTVEAKAYGKYVAVRDFLYDFVASGLQCAVVDEYPHKHANSCSTSLRKAALRERLYHIKVVVRKSKVYLINELIVDDKKIK